MAMIPDSFPNIPTHVVDLFTHSAEVDVDLNFDHAPHRLLTFVYKSFDFHDPVMQLNAKSPISVRVGDRFHLFDKTLIGKLHG